MNVALTKHARWRSGRVSSMEYSCRFCLSPMPKPRTGDKRRCMACRKQDAVYCTTNKLGARQVWACIHCCRETGEKPKTVDRTCSFCNKKRAVRCFRSLGELKRWIVLRAREKRGEIRNLTSQPVFPIIIEGKSLKSLKRYEADASYFEGNTQVVEDFKGFRTPIYKVKKELVEILYPGVTITEVTRNG